EGQIQTPDRELALAQDGERLGRSDLVNQVQVDVQNGRRVGSLRQDLVAAPDLLEQSQRCGCHGTCASPQPPAAAARGADMSTASSHPHLSVVLPENRPKKAACRDSVIGPRLPASIETRST